MEIERMPECIQGGAAFGKVQGVIGNHNVVLDNDSFQS